MTREAFHIGTQLKSEIERKHFSFLNTEVVFVAGDERDCVLEGGGGDEDAANGIQETC